MCFATGKKKLLLPIGRNELGHRYYTRYDIQVILCIKELKKKRFFIERDKKSIPLFYETVKQEETNSKGDNLEREVLEKENSQRISEIKNLEKAERKFETAVNSVSRSAYSGKRKKAQKAARAREQKKKKEQNRQTNKPDGRRSGVPKEFMESFEPN